jgi:hypothetical protein
MPAKSSAKTMKRLATLPGFRIPNPDKPEPKKMNHESTK